MCNKFEQLYKSIYIQVRDALLFDLLQFLNENNHSQVTMAVNTARDCSTNGDTFEFTLFRVLSTRSRHLCQLGTGREKIRTVL